MAEEHQEANSNYQSRSLWQYIILALKGMLMGAADIVPGVSGGTIAFISGIYEELLESIKNISPSLLMLWKRNGFVAVWHRTNATFLVVLFAGVVLSMFLLANAVTFALAHYSLLVWAGFFGLTVAAAIYIAAEIDRWSLLECMAFSLAAGVAYGISIGSSGSAIEASVLVMFLGAILASCAMILPGVSGSFLLLLLGLYAPFIHAIKSFNVELLLAIVSGVAVGLIVFSKFLSWLLVHHRNVTMSALTGFMVGGLNKVWPWKEVITYRTNSHGEQVPLIEQNISPVQYEQLLGQDPMLAYVLACVSFGAGLVVVMAYFSKSNKQTVVTD